MRKKNFVIFAIAVFTPLIWAAVWIVCARCTSKGLIHFFFRNTIKWLNDKHQRIESELFWNVLMCFLDILQSLKNFNYCSVYKNDKKVVFCFIHIFFHGFMAFVN